MNFEMNAIWNIKAWRVIALIILWACDTVEVEPPEILDAEDKLVMNAIFSPASDTITVEISMSEKIFGIIPEPSSNIVSDAVVTISDGSLTRTLSFDDVQKVYILPATQFSLEKEVTYRLELTANNKTVYAETSLPYKVNRLESVELNDSNALQISWQDLPNEKNYYRVYAESLYNRREGTDGEVYYSRYKFFDNDFITDAHKDGQLLSVTSDALDEFQNRFDSVSIEVYSVDELYWDYFRVLDLDTEEDPFSEPVQLPSNVVGGIGIFSIFQVSKFKMKWP